MSGEDYVEEELGLYGVYTTSEVKKYQTTVHINNEQIVKEIDTGAAVSIIPESLYSAKFVHFPLVKSKVVLKTYSNERLQVLGEVQLSVYLQGQNAIVVKGNNPTLLGRDWPSK